MNHEGSSQVLGALAPRRVPEAYVRAEVACFPLTHPEAFRRSVMVLEPELEGPSGQPTRELWRECERSLSEHASGWSLDRLIAVRDLFWFSQPKGHRARYREHAVSLEGYLRHLAQTHLEPRSGLTEVAQGTSAETVETLSHYRWLTFALPEDLLLSALPVSPPATRVNLEPPLLMRHLLDQGVTEIHHHLGAGMDFPLMWAALLSALGEPDLVREAMRGPGLPFGEDGRLLDWLLAAAVARCVLAEFLLRGGEASLSDFVLALRHASSLRPPQWRVLWRTLGALAWGQDNLLPDFEELHDLYGELHPLAHRNASEPPETLDEVWRRCDPLAVRLQLNKPNAGERWWVRNGLAWLEHHAWRYQGQPDALDELFSRVFWQTVRLRCLCYRSFVQRPMTAGLQWFLRFYGRLHVLRGPLRAARAEASYYVAGGNQPIASLEVRTSPFAEPLQLAEELWRMLRSWRHVLRQTGSSCGGHVPEFGVVLHLTKSRDPRQHWLAGAPPAHGRGTYAEPRPRDELRLGGRFADYHTTQSVKVQALVDLLRAVPLALWLVRGLDVASDELGVPTWVLVPLYRFVRRESARVAALTSSRRAPPLRLTAHVGEDFRHLMEGLRRIYECVYYQLDRTGGRLGHATALGVEPRMWAESVGAVMMPAEERLWDLVFEWRLYSRFRLPPDLWVEAPPGRPQQVQNAIRELSDHVFGRDFQPPVLAEAHHVLHTLWCPPLVREGAELGLDAFSRAFQRVDWFQVQSHRGVGRLLSLYRECEDVYLRGQELVDIALEGSEVEALRAVQDGLRRCVAARGIVVEVNPSSNLLIGNLLDLRNHPILRLFPPQAQEGAPPPVPIAVGADDPITFSTFLLREYSLLHEAAVSAGYSERVVHEWLSAIRQTSMDARFTVPWRPTPMSMTEALLNALGSYLMKPS